MIEQSRPLSLLLALASLFIIIFGIQATAPILNPILLAAVITIAVLPLPGKFMKRGLPGWLGLVLTVVIVVGVMVLVMLLVVGGISRLGLLLPTYAQSIAQRSAEVTAGMEGSVEQTTATTATLDPAAVGNGIAWMIGVIGNGLVTVFTALLIFVFMLFAAINLPSSSRASLKLDMPIVERVSGLTADVRKYLGVTTMINLLVALGDTVLLLILGVDLAFLWGILSWVLGYIPAVGFWLALIPPTILAWAELGPSTALIVFLGYVLINGSVQNFVQPKMMGDNLNISPVVVFLSLFIWSFMLGSMGALLAVPLTLLIISTLDSFESTRWMVTLIRVTPHRQDEAEQQKARKQIRGLWERARVFVRPEVAIKEMEGGVQPPLPLETTKRNEDGQ
jgi:predicted PurR-regulated permease PerM